MFFRKGGSLFVHGVKGFSSHAPKGVHSSWFKSQLDSVGLMQKISRNQLQKSLPSTKVYFNKNYLQDSRKVHDSLVKVPAINVSGDRDVVFQSGVPFTGKRDYFKQIPEGHPELLSPQERLNAGKKIVHSDSVVFARGGYPSNNPLRLYKKPFHARIFSLAGASFENDYLHSRLFMLDLYNPAIKQGTPFDSLFKGVPIDFSAAKKEIGNYDGTDDLSRIRLGFTLLARTGSGVYYPTFRKDSSVIFLTKPYFRHQLEDISMLLSATNESAHEAGKPALLKATAVGMGFFAKIDGAYDIQHLLFPYYLRAYKKLLEEHTYPWVAQIEFPVFNELQEMQFDGVFEDYKGPVKVYRTRRDVLEFTEQEIEEFTPCLVNPSDVFALTGNEWGYGSVEAMIGLNSSLRMDQVHHTNPRILEPENHVGVQIHPDYSAELVKSAELTSGSSLKV
ncbi:type IV secretion protein Dot [Legionella waltersii]|uniref:Substrate of the Dot/Icm secretion system n=1 Tax=Legionella waltersii TaxID=66969 RepID=A0A0W1A5E8_9GAMM|nr:type IV secretion protein Dot [Legionella waltersii]KTD76534.1 substrate of the Dot/Icm secretion system [Legionella waltersii]SNU93988.1 Dot/Icm secretion system substrate [Legionella waltersii]